MLLLYVICPWRRALNVLHHVIHLQMGALNSALEAGLAATKISLEVMTTANSEAEAAAKRNALQANLNALRAEGNACWANAEGMRAEEAISRRLLADEAAAKEVRTTLASRTHRPLQNPTREESKNLCSCAAGSFRPITMTVSRV